MKKIKLYIAISLNGKIARKDGRVDWLDAVPNPDKDDYGYNDFYNSIDTTVQGFNTYRQLMEWDLPFPYSGKENYVITRRKGLSNTEQVQFISSNHVETIKEIKNGRGKDIWLIGGGHINTLMLNHDLIDEMLIFVMPIIIHDGIELFEEFPDDTHLKLVDTKKYISGVVQLHYQKNQNG